jgi:hypothetical protein
MQHYGWQEANTIYRKARESTWGEGANRALTSELKQANIQVAASQAYRGADDAGTISAMRAFTALEGNVYVSFLFHEQYAGFLAAAVNTSVYRTGSVIIANDEVCEARNLTGAYAGILGMCQIATATPYNAWYNSFSGLSVSADNNFGPLIAAFAYDALDALVRAMNATAANGTTLDGSLASGLAIKNMLLNMTAFQGKTGTVAITSSGDREKEMYVQNLHSSAGSASWVHVGNFSSTSGLAINEAAVSWPNTSSKAVPLDRWFVYVGVLMNEVACPTLSNDAHINDMGRPATCPQLECIAEYGADVANQVLSGSPLTIKLRKRVASYSQREDVSEAVKAALYKAMGIAGTGRARMSTYSASAASQYVDPLTNVINPKPQIDWGAMDKKLGNKDAFPTFVFTYPNAVDEALAYARVVISMGYRKIGLMASSGHFGESQPAALNTISEQIFGEGQLLIDPMAMVTCKVCDVSRLTEDTEHQPTDFSGLQRLGLNFLVLTGWPSAGSKNYELLAADLKKQGFLSPGYGILASHGYYAFLLWKDSQGESLADWTGWLTLGLELPGQELDKQMHRKCLELNSTDPVFAAESNYLRGYNLSQHTRLFQMRYIVDTIAAFAHAANQVMADNPKGAGPMLMNGTAVLNALRGISFIGSSTKDKVSGTDSVQFANLSSYYSCTTNCTSKVGEVPVDTPPRGHSWRLINVQRGRLVDVASFTIAAGSEAVSSRRSAWTTPLIFSSQIEWPGSKSGLVITTAPSTTKRKCEPGLMYNGAVCEPPPFQQLIDNVPEMADTQLQFWLRNVVKTPCVCMDGYYYTLRNNHEWGSYACKLCPSMGAMCRFGFVFPMRNYWLSTVDWTAYQHGFRSSEPRMPRECFSGSCIGVSQADNATDASGMLQNVHFKVLLTALQGDVSRSIFTGTQYDNYSQGLYDVTPTDSSYAKWSEDPLSASSSKDVFCEEGSNGILCMHCVFPYTMTSSRTCNLCGSGYETTFFFYILYMVAISVFDCMGALGDTYLLEDAVKENAEASAMAEAAHSNTEEEPHLERDTGTVTSVDGLSSVTGTMSNAFSPAQKAEMSYQTHYVVRIVLGGLNVTSLVLQVNIDWNTVDGGEGVYSSLMYTLLEAQKFLSGKSASDGKSAGFLECTFHSNDGLLMPYGRALFASLLFYTLPVVSAALLWMVWRSSYIHTLLFAETAHVKKFTDSKKKLDLALKDRSTKKFEEEVWPPRGTQQEAKLVANVETSKKEMDEARERGLKRKGTWTTIRTVVFYTLSANLIFCCIQAVNIVNVEEFSKAGIQVLLEDSAEPYMQGSGAGWQIFSWLMLILFFVIFCYDFSSLRSLGSKGNIDEMMPYAHMIGAYKHAFAYWNFVSLIRQVVLTGAMTWTIPSGGIMQLLLAMLILLFFIVLHLAVQPYANQMLHQLETFSLMSSFFTFWGFAMIYGFFTESAEDKQGCYTYKESLNSLIFALVALVNAVFVAWGLGMFLQLSFPSSCAKIALKDWINRRAQGFFSNVKTGNSLLTFPFALVIGIIAFASAARSQLVKANCEPVEDPGILKASFVALTGIVTFSGVWLFFWSIAGYWPPVDVIMVSRSIEEAFPVHKETTDDGDEENGQALGVGISMAHKVMHADKDQESSQACDVGVEIPMVVPAQGSALNITVERLVGGVEPLSLELGDDAKFGDAKAQVAGWWSIPCKQQVFLFEGKRYDASTDGSAMVLSGVKNGSVLTLVISEGLPPPPPPPPPSSTIVDANDDTWQETMQPGSENKVGAVVVGVTPPQKCWRNTRTGAISIQRPQPRTQPMQPPVQENTTVTANYAEKAAQMHYTKELMELKEMGFGDLERNVEALGKVEGHQHMTQAAMNYLL